MGGVSTKPHMRQETGRTPLGTAYQLTTPFPGKIRNLKFQLHNGDHCLITTTTSEGSQHCPTCQTQTPPPPSVMVRAAADFFRHPIKLALA